MKKNLKVQFKKYGALLSNNFRLFFIIGMLLLLSLEIYFLPLLVLMELNLVIGLYVLIKLLYNRYYKNTKLFQLEAELKIPVLGFVENIKNKIIFRFRVLNEAKKRKLYMELIGHIIVLLVYLIILKCLRSYISVLVGIGLVINLIGRIRGLWYILGLNEIGLLVNPFKVIPKDNSIKLEVLERLLRNESLKTPEKIKALEFKKNLRGAVSDKNRIDALYFDQFRYGSQISVGVEQFNYEKKLNVDIVNKIAKNDETKNLFFKDGSITQEELGLALNISTGEELDECFKQLNRARTIIQNTVNNYTLDEIRMFEKMTFEESVKYNKELVEDYNKLVRKGDNSYYLPQNKAEDVNLPTLINEQGGVAYERVMNPSSNVYNLDSSGAKFWEKNKKETPDILVTNGNSVYNSYSLEQKNIKTEDSFLDHIDNPESLRNEVRERGISGTLVFGPLEIQETVLGKEASEDKKLAPHKVDDPEFLERMVENYQRGNPHRNLDTNELLENSKKEQEIRKNENNGN